MGDLVREQACPRSSRRLYDLHIRQAHTHPPSSESSTYLIRGLIGGLSFDLMRYWDGQPVRFVCCERASGGGKRDANGVRLGDANATGDEDEELPWGKVLWSVCIELVEE